MNEKEANTERGLPWSREYHTTSSHIVRYCLVLYFLNPSKCPRKIGIELAISFSEPNYNFRLRC